MDLSSVPKGLTGAISDHASFTAISLAFSVDCDNPFG
jgi:hypothetical protein